VALEASTENLVVLARFDNSLKMLEHLSPFGTDKVPSLAQTCDGTAVE
jgi:hypothetical protein